MIDGLDFAPLSVPDLRKRLAEEEATVAELARQHGAASPITWKAGRVARAIRSELKRRER